MIVNFDHVKPIHRKTEVDNKYKILFDGTINGWEWGKLYQELCDDLAEQFDMDESDYITDMIMEEI